MAADFDAIWAALDKDGIYVHPSMADTLTPQQLAEAKANIARSEDPIYVAVYPLREDDEFNGDPANFAATLHDVKPEPGLYLATDTRWDRTELGGASWDLTAPTNDDYTVDDAAFAAKYEHPDDLGAQIVAATEMIADGTASERQDAAYKVYEKQQDQSESSTSQPSSYPSEDGSGTVVGVSVAIAAVAVVVAGAMLWRRMKAEAGALPRPTQTFTLPSSVIERVRDAHDSALVDRADRELLALGELIDETDMSGDTAAWQAALDHYDAAKRARGDSKRPDVLDVVGALVLVERGSAALAAATAGKTYEPQAPCYLNPLHGRATGRTRLDTPSGKVDVPLCAQCRRDLKAKRRPDILDVVRGGKPVHYFDSKVEPWASTGYGALDPDLVTQLQRTRR